MFRRKDLQNSQFFDTSVRLNKKAMAQAKDVILRQQIAAEHDKGATYSSLAQGYGMSYNTVRTICMRYKAMGEVGLVPRYSNCGRSVVAGAERSFRLVRLLKHVHPTWGIGYILVRIGLNYPHLALQSERHYQRRLSEGKSSLPQPQLPAAAPTERSRLAHDTWQIDAKERIGAADGQEYCFLNITDEKTAALLKAKAFSPGADLPGDLEGDTRLADRAV